MLRRLETLTRWSDLEVMFGIHASALSVIFWEKTELFMPMAQRAELYANGIRKKGAPLDFFVGLVDCPEVQISRHGGHGVIQRGC